MQGAPYRNKFGPDSVEELKNNINSTHEDFLREDDPVKKADALRYMSAYAMQYLYLVPHDRKFILKETERLLHQSAMNISSFDPREASIAFEYVGRYAQNILDQPWRKDFHTIKLTSGFYVHNISAQLSNAHEILVAMGYVHMDETTLNVVPKLDEKRIKNVSRDMVVASQECLILSQIWQRVADQEPDYPLNIGEVFEFRRKHLGDTDTICRTMLMDIRRRQHEEKMQRRTTTGKSFVPVDKLIDYEEMDIDSRDCSGGINEDEVVEKVLHHTRTMHDNPPRYNKQEEEHIYDPVYPGSGGITNGGAVMHKNYSSLYPGGTSGSAFVPLSKHSPDVGGRSQSQYYARDAVSSPLIPQTVTNFRSDSYSTSSRRSDSGFQLPLSSGGSSSNSSSGIGDKLTSQASNKSNYALGTNPPLQFSKILPNEANEDWEKEKEKFNRRKTENHHGPTGQSGQVIHWSEWSGHSNVEKPVQTHRRRHSERPVAPESTFRNENSSRSRKPIMPNDVYPDDYFPRVVKPTPIHSTTQHGHNNPIGSSSTNRHLPASPKARSPTIEENLDSLGTLYFQKLLKNNTADKSGNSPVDDKMSSSSNQEDLREASRSRSPTREEEAAPRTRTTTTTGTTMNDGDLNFNTRQGPTSNKSMQDKQIISPVNAQPKIVPWNCRFCTFKNKKAERICEVCSKSKDFFEEEEEEENEVEGTGRVTPSAPPKVSSSSPTPSVPKLYSQSNPNKTSNNATPTLVLRDTNKDPNMLECSHCTFLNPICYHQCTVCLNVLH